jgi:cytidylate kinase
MTTKAMIIAIDGAAGSGKSTLARGLARTLGLPYVNTGLMYRALTCAALEGGVDADDERGLKEVARDLRFTLAGARPRELSIEGLSPGADLQSTLVEAAVSQVSRHPRVRSLMRELQRKLGKGGVVMEGRDIASVVFPDADVKLYLVADADVRERRRSEERSGDPSAPKLGSRDRKDAAVNPFVPQPGAVVIDTTDVDVEETLRAAIDVVARAREGRS